MNYLNFLQRSKMNWIARVLGLLLSTSIIAQEEQIIVFTQDSDALFIQETLPKVKAFSVSEDIQIYHMDAATGLPENITATPAILFRNGKGISTYAGRYTSFSTIKNFVRSSRVVPQQDKTLDNVDMLVRQNGKMQITASLKITDIKPTTVLINEIEFQSAAKRGIEQGLSNYQYQEIVELERTDRIFYLDFHPYFISQDSLILSVELYSQFSCIEPIYSSKAVKISGADIESVFKNAAELLGKEIESVLAASKLGDAYNAVHRNNKNKSLAELNIPKIAEKSLEFRTVNPDRRIPKNWIFKSAVNSKLPILQFNFMEPLTRYAGEITRITGSINFNQKGELMNGLFEATMKSLTMGDESFDKKVLKEYVKSKSNPKAIFNTNTIINTEKLMWSKTSNVTLQGAMELMKKERPISVNVNLTPYVDNKGEEVLLVQANWSMNITDGWKIKGPDGPDPAKKTLEFSLNVLMQPN